MCVCVLWNPCRGVRLRQPYLTACIGCNGCVWWAAAAAAATATATATATAVTAAVPAVDVDPDDGLHAVGVHHTAIHRPWSAHTLGCVGRADCPVSTVVGQPEPAML